MPPLELPIFQFFMRVASVDPSNSQQSSESNCKLACCTEGQFPSSTSSSDFGAITENYDIDSLPNRHALSDDTRRLELCACSKRSNDFQVPQSSGRRYNPSWETLFSWLRYSVSLDAAYCAPCFILAIRNKNAELIDKPINDWKNAVGTKWGRINAHSNSDIHRQSLVAANNFLQVAQDEMKPITSFISQAYADRVARNRSIMKSLLDIVLVCAQRGFPLRGHLWNKDEQIEDGNFSYLVRWAAKTDAALQSHLETAAHNAKYLSPTIQNELLAWIESEIREQIVRQCNKSPFISVMADETTDCGGTEKLALCVQYIHEEIIGKFEVGEDFLGFIALKTTNAENITDKMLEKLPEGC
jgi:Domain of unknown function (DUF4371)